MEPEQFKNLIGSTASICTILQFLTGILVCYKIIRTRATGELSSFPFISGALSTLLWLRYGILIKEEAIMVVNAIGSSLFMSYVVVYLLYSSKKKVVVRQIYICLSLLVIILIYIHKIRQFEDAKETLGIICCLVTVVFFAAPLITLLKVIETKNSDSLPFPVIFANFIVSLQWLIYGFILGDQFIQMPNLLGSILSALQLSLFLLFPKSGKLQSNYTNESV